MGTRIVPEMWLAGRDLSEPRLSPDGRSIAFVTSWGSRSAVAITPTSGDGPERLLTSSPEPRVGRGLGGGCFDWLPDGSGLVVAMRDGVLWMIPVGGGPARRLDAGDSTRPATHPTVSPDGTAVAFVVDMATIGVVRIGTGAVSYAPVTADFVADPAWTPDSSTLIWQQWSVPAMPWDSSGIGRWVLGEPSADELEPCLDRQIQQPRVLSDGRLISVRDDDGWLNVAIDNQSVLAEAFEHAGPTWGLGQRTYAISPDGTRIAIARNEDGFGRLVVIDRASGATRQLGRGVHGQVDWRGDTITAIRSGACTPTQIVAYDADSGRRRIVAVGPVLGFDDTNLVEPELVHWPADDGVTVHGRLYRSQASGGRLICWVHGGPTDQWQVSFIPRIAYWVQQGWSVLVPDHRGSTGHGRAYQQAMAGRWGDLDTSDTAAGLVAAHARGWGVAGRTVAMGSSAGGLTVLNVCRRHPRLVAAAVTLYPVSDLAALDATTHRFEAHYNATLVGSAEVAGERYADRSPALHSDELGVPLLVFHGTDDPVVSIEQSRRLVEAMSAAGRDVALVEYAGEGHGFRQAINQLDEVARTREFLDRIIR